MTEIEKLPPLTTAREIPARELPEAPQRRLVETFKAKIEQGEWKLGELIPRELDLMQEYGTSRYMIRQVLNELVRSGRLVRTKKRGTVVSLPKVEQSLASFYSFAVDMTAKGFKPASLVLELEEVTEPDEDTARLLELGNYNPLKVFNLRRLRVVNDEPLVIESSFLAFTGPVDLFRFDWRVLPLYEVLEKEYGLKVERATEYLEPVILDKYQSHLLEVENGSPAFRVERLTYDASGRVFERRVSLIRGDRYRFYVELPKKELVGELGF
jgi:GntR family transcriptional regulator